MEQPEGLDQWALSRLGFAIDSYVDREINQATRISDNTSYGVGYDGRMYLSGTPSAGTMAAQKPPINTTFLILVLAGVFLAMQK